MNALDLMPRGFALLAVQFHGRGAGQAPLSAAHNGGHHLQVSYQLAGGSHRRFYRDLPLRFEKQFGGIQDALADDRRAFPPSRIQFACSPCIAVLLHEDRGHPLAVFQVDARRRHQTLHGHVRRDFPLTDLLLDRFRQKFHQCQAPRHPTHTAVKPPSQLLQAITKTLLQFCQQPALFQCGFVFAQTQRTIQQQCLGFTHRPDHCLHCVSTQLPERRDALVPINHHITVWLNTRDHHNRYLLSRFGQRGKQPSLPSRMACPQVLPPPVELVKLQSHAHSLVSRFSMGQTGSGLSPPEGEVDRELSSYQLHTHGTGLSRCALGVRP